MQKDWDGGVRAIKCMYLPMANTLILVKIEKGFADTFLFLNLKTTLSSLLPYSALRRLGNSKTWIHIKAFARLYEHRAELRSSRRNKFATGRLYQLLNITVFRNWLTHSLKGNIGWALRIIEKGSRTWSLTFVASMTLIFIIPVNHFTSDNNDETCGFQFWNLTPFSVIKVTPHKQSSRWSFLEESISQQWPDAHLLQSQLPFRRE